MYAEFFRVQVFLTPEQNIPYQISALTKAVGAVELDGGLPLQVELTS